MCFACAMSSFRPLFMLRSRSRIVLVLCAGLVQAAAAQQAGGGQGRPLGDGGWYAGGYATLSAQRFEGDRGRVRLDNLSLLLWLENDSPWSVFTELELENVVEFSNAGSAGADRELVLERLHVDYAFADQWSLRVGKFLTPIGRWNQIHAAPLTWTTSRPLITESTFPTNATGLMVRGVRELGSRALEWSVYVSPGRELLAEDDLDTFREAVGGRVDLEWSPTLKFGLSLAEFEQQRQRDEHRTLAGVDFLYRRDSGLELSGEFAVRTRERDRRQTDERGAYVQAVVPLADRWYGVARYEGFDVAGASADLHLYLAGLAWRWQPGWVAKLEWRHATENGPGTPEGFLGSIAVLY